MGVAPQQPFSQSSFGLSDFAQVFSRFARIPQKVIEEWFTALYKGCGLVRRLHLESVESTSQSRCLGTKTLCAALSSITTVITAVSILTAMPAQADDWVITIQKRTEERKQERWSLATHLAAKAASSQQDLWYRFFLGKRDPKPRLELVAGGIGQSIRDQVGSGTLASPETGPQARTINHAGTGYNLRLAFNHFVSGTTGIPTLNIVPNFTAEVLDASFSKERQSFSPGSSMDASSTEIGGGFRLFGSSHSDTALYLDYMRRRQWVPQGSANAATTGAPLSGYEFESWFVRARAQFYLASSLALTGSVIVDESIAPGHVRDKRLQLFEQSIGGNVDLAMFRLSYDYRERTFAPRRDMSQMESRRVTSFVHQIGVGFIF